MTRTMGNYDKSDRGTVRGQPLARSRKPATKLLALLKTLVALGGSDIGVPSFSVQ
jgi:hypothetical protein